MVLSVIIGAILGYVLLMFLMHEMFKKFFHMILFVSFVVFAAAVAYLMLKGNFF